MAADYKIIGSVLIVRKSSMIPSIAMRGRQALSELLVWPREIRSSGMDRDVELPKKVTLARAAKAKSRCFVGLLWVATPYQGSPGQRIKVRLGKQRSNDKKRAPEFSLVCPNDPLSQGFM